MLRRASLVWVLVAVVAGFPALAQDSSFAATLTGQTGSSARCAASFSYDDLGRQLTYRLTCDGLTGSATMLHVFGPNQNEVNMMVEVRSTPIIGTASLSDAEAASLKAGTLSVEVQTIGRPQGEVGGLIVPR